MTTEQKIEPMTREEVRVLLDGEFCGCGSPDAALATMLRLLRLHPLFDHRAELEAWLTEDGIRFLLLYGLQRMGLTEHGTSIEGAWLTEKGRALLAALEAEEASEFEALIGMHCIHGVSMEEDDARCDQCAGEWETSG